MTEVTEIFYNYFSSIMLDLGLKVLDTKTVWKIEKIASFSKLEH